MDRKGMTRSALARATGVDRSTIGQVLRPDQARLPGAQLTADAAAVLGVSTDWLLGLTDRPERPGDIVAAAVAVSPAERSSADAQLLGWHQEAAGYRVRHVPATLPDILKTDAMLDWEYAGIREHGAQHAIGTTQQLRDWLMSGISDYEIALPLHEVRSCAEGTGYYAGLDRATRHAQLRAIADLCDRMYPKMKLFLFDARQVYSAPASVFGPRLAVVYMGRFYMAFRESGRVRSLSDHFDWLVREARVDARDAAAHIGAVIGESAAS